ncbi:MAG: PIG-L family deacetylase [Planctomycetes bacterium]|nr:PIG-L family deacetylase [Planctomycetota bacterium]
MGIDNWQKVLVVSPHTDDGELSCGGTMARLVAEGREVHYLVLSSKYVVDESRFKPETPRDEMHEAMKVLGVTQIHVRDIPVRHFSTHRQDILQCLWDFNAKHKPDAVFCPSLRDLHQDHNAVAHEAMRAFKKTNIFGYEQPWNTHVFSTECFVRLEAEHIDKKIAALRCYASQADRTYLQEEVIRGWARTRGVQIGCEYAECFEIPRLVI